MKKVLVLVMGLGMLISCSEEGVDDAAMQTSSIQAVMAAAQPSTSGRTDVKRGTVYAWVKDVTIEAESQVTAYTAQETYDLLDSGDDGYDDAAAIVSTKRCCFRSKPSISCVYNI